MGPTGGDPLPKTEPGVIWTRPNRTGRGPRPAHTRTEIAATATRIADTDGLDAVSMRRLAAEIGCGTMSLYNYIPRKEDLHELMVDAASAEYDLTTPLTGNWRDDALQLATQSRDLLRRHPWLLRLVDSAAYGFTPHTMRFIDRFLAALEPMRIPPGTKMELLAMVNATVMAYVTNEHAVAERARSLPWTPQEEQEIRTAYLTGELATGAYPHLAAALTATAAETLDYDAFFTRSVVRVLDAFALEEAREQPASAADEPTATP
ncbi:TetR/AcrR family transcriptional regulator [Streptomyces sp. NPDC051940]|uniref:TetR/AcrR family transcriptional regulator n=1 Tax=Streptomyces sp. NPDC051940 TaxID=3155675 RepID=UPI00343BE995